RFARMLLRHGEVRGRPFLKADTIALFTARAGIVPGSSRALGWDTMGEGGSCGRYFSPGSFGHTGFTGTSLWIDPRRQLFVILLTNRVHPRREGAQITDLRRAIHEAAAAYVDAQEGPLSA